MQNTERPQYFGRDLEAMSFAVNYHRWIIREFEPFLGGQVAEVGAGTGNFTGLLVDHVDRLTAFEPSANMFPLLEEKTRSNPAVTAINSFFDSQAPDSRFDTILYVNVLEHVEDDLQEARSMFKALNRGGHALIFVPALSWLYSELDRQLGHFRRYHRKDLRGLFSQAGFEVERCHYFDVAGIIPWYLVFVLMKKTVSPGKVSLYDRLVVPVMKTLEGVITPPVGKNLLLVARKP